MDTPQKGLENLNLNTPHKRSRTADNVNELHDVIKKRHLTSMVADISSREKLYKILKKVNKIRRKEMKAERIKREEEESRKKLTAASQPVQRRLGEYSGPPARHSDGLKVYLETFQSMHYSVYALYCPLGTLEDQFNSIFYFGLTKSILDRLWQHKKYPKKDFPEKWEFFNGIKRYPAIAIVELYSDDYAKSTLMEILFIKHAINLGLNIVNRRDNNTHNQPDPENAKFHKELIMYALENGVKYGCVRNIPAKRSFEFKAERNNQIMIRRIEDEEFVKKSSKAVKKWKDGLPEDVDDARRKHDNKNTGEKRQVHPVKRPVHAYNFWVADGLPRIRKENPGRTNAEYQRMASEAWKIVTKNPEEKRIFDAMAAADVKRFEKELEVYREKHQK